MVLRENVPHELADPVGVAGGVVSREDLRQRRAKAVCAGVAVLTLDRQGPQNDRIEAVRGAGNELRGRPQPGRAGGGEGRTGTEGAWREPLAARE